MAVDVGGLGDKSDWSVVAVVRRGATPRVVAQWRGHVDHDLLAWKGAMVASFYNNARLVFESNTSRATPTGRRPYTSRAR